MVGDVAGSDVIGWLVDYVDVSLDESDGEERRAKSLRNGVHNANGVVWGPV